MTARPQNTQNKGQTLKFVDADFSFKKKARSFTFVENLDSNCEICQEMDLRLDYSVFNQSVRKMCGLYDIWNV